MCRYSGKQGAAQLRSHGTIWRHAEGDIGEVKQRRRVGLYGGRTVFRLYLPVEYFFLLSFTGIAGKSVEYFASVADMMEGEGACVAFFDVDRVVFEVRSDGLRDRGHPGDHFALSIDAGNGGLHQKENLRHRYENDDEDTNANS